MAAPLGNQFWKLRSKHGRDKLFETPPLLWEAAQEYFEWVDANPLTRSEQRKGTVVIPKGFEGDLADIQNPIIEVEVGRPYTWEGLCIYLDCSPAYFRVFKLTMVEKKEGASEEEIKQQKDFLTIISRIEQSIYNQKFDGAAVGLFNGNIIARSLGLREHNELSTPPDGEGEFKVTLNL